MNQIKKPLSHYQRTDIFSKLFYIIEWLPRKEKRIVTGAFIRGHFENYKLLSEASASKSSLELKLSQYA